MIEGPKVSQENSPHTITPPPAAAWSGPSGSMTSKERATAQIRTGRMETGPYVNSSFVNGRNGGERRDDCRSGGSKMNRLVGVSFGLLCIVQATLNVSLRLQAVGSRNKSDSSTDDIRALNLERDQLIQEKQQLLQDKDQLVQDKNKLAKEKEELQATNRILVKDTDVLKERVLGQQNQIKELQAKMEIEGNTPKCPLGWWTYKSSCYQLSSMTGTWEHARQDCESKGAQLVVLNNDREENVVRSFGAVQMWMGLSLQRDKYSAKWTWVDGNLLPTANVNLQRECRNTRGCRCANIDGAMLWLKTWFIHHCEDRHYWMCEKEPFMI
ncbi:oxidized low-density lipoprotein receptor 1-like isoform X2 [Trachinotus anak]|uniref:oxidized low-density lipoprotein receptor 1-like isoform X2 n=1 Tax=Trachinotus anak TaxID=443729 RepID=UPI0039F1B2AA